MSSRVALSPRGDSIRLCCLSALRESAVWYLGEAVREEVEENLLLHATRLSSQEADELIENYRGLIRLTKPELIPYPDADAVRSNRHLIRHESDVPVLLSAMAAKPDWLLTNNTKHFTQAVAHRTGLRIATPVEFFKTLSSLLQ